MTFWKRLKERKLVQWALAYLAGAWVLLQLTSVLGGMYDLPRTLVRSVPVLLAVGFLAALVLAWYHGEKGRQRVSGPELLMLGALLLIAGAAVAWVGGGAEHPAVAAEPPGAAGVVVDARSLAVLPFADLSEAGDQKWFAEGLAEEILISLSRLPELRVVGRNSSFLFTAGATDDRVIADTLGVAHLVKGSVRRVGDRLRVTAQLVRAADGMQLWSEAYDRDAADLLDVQRDVAEKVAAALDILLDDERRERMFAAGTRNVEAFETFLRGREIFLAAHAGQGSLAEANTWLERAMSLDPRFGRPALLHADRYMHRVIFGPDDSIANAGDVSVEVALERLHRSLDLAARHAPDSYHRVMAELNREFFSPTWHRLPRLISELGRQIEAGNPTLDDNWAAHVLVVTGNLDLAREWAERALRADPLEAFLWRALVHVEMAAGDFDRVRALLADGRRTLGERPRLERTDFLVAVEQPRLERAEFNLAVLTGDRDAAVDRSDRWAPWFAQLVRGDAEAVLERARGLGAEDDWPRAGLLHIYHELGERERSRDLVRRIDALPTGAAILATEIFQSGRALTFDLADAPNFAARLREAGTDGRSFAVMPRLSVAGGSQP